MNTAYATLAIVTDRRDPSPRGDGSPDRGLTADQLIAATGGVALGRSDRPILGGAVDSREVRQGNLFNYSFVGYIGRQTGVPDLIVAIRIEEGTPTVARVGHLEMPVMSFELFRRIATDAIGTPDLLADRPVTTQLLTPDQ